MAADSQPETTQDEDEWLNQVNKEKSRRGLPSHRAVVLEESFKAGESPKFVEVDLQHPTNSQRRLILDAALQTKDMDNGRLLWKIRQRLDRQAMHACTRANAASAYACTGQLSPMAAAPSVASRPQNIDIEVS